MEALFVLALVSGMRRGEILELKWRDVNLAEGVIAVQRSLVDLKGGIIESRPKSSRGYRSILLPPFALEILKKHKEQQASMREKARSGWRTITFFVPRMERQLPLCPRLSPVLLRKGKENRFVP